MRYNFLLKVFRLGIQYRIITDKTEFRIEYKTFLLPFWRLHKEIYGTTFFIPTHASKSSTESYIKHLKEKDLPEKWRPIDE